VNAMIEAILTDHPPPIEARRRSRRSDRDSSRQRSRTAAFVVGAIVLLDDGTRCRIELIDHHGTAWCYPLQETTQ